MYDGRGAGIVVAGLESHLLFGLGDLFLVVYQSFERWETKRTHKAEIREGWEESDLVGGLWFKAAEPFYSH